MHLYFIFNLRLYSTRQSYDVTIDLRVEGSGLTSSNTLDLKNPYFRYAGQPAQPPPGHSTTSPSETYWAQLDVQGARQGNLGVMLLFVCDFNHCGKENPVVK